MNVGSRCLVLPIGQLQGMARWCSWLVLTLFLFQSSDVASQIPSEKKEDSAEVQKAEDRTSPWRTRPIHVESDILIGTGIQDDLSLARPPHPDTAIWTTGRSGVALQFRYGVYRLPIGLVTHVDYSFKPLGGASASNRFSSESSSLYLRLLAAFRLGLLSHRLEFEPLLGYGWLRDRATIKERDEKVYREEYDGHGLVFGLDQRIEVTEHLALRSIYTYGNYEVTDNRLKVELQVGLIDTKVSSAAIRTRSGEVFFLVLGFHGAWKGDDRIDRMIYFGIGGAGFP